MIKTFLMLIVLTLVANLNSLAQLSLVSSNPNHGDVNVDTSLTFTLTFNEALDTSARFEYPGEFFLNLYLYPDSLIGDPDSISLSPDLKTVYVHNLHLTSNVIYLFTLVDAVGLSGDSLDWMHSIVFTTATGLPVADVSGSLTYPGKDPAGTWVVLLDNYPFKERKGEIVYGIVIPPSINFYTVDYVTNGWYWIAAIKDFHIDDEGNPRIEPGSGIGFYDSNSDHILDSIYVTTGSHTIGIDFSLHEAVLHSARDQFPTVEAVAQNWSADASFNGLFGEVNPNGNSTTWQYLFYSSSLMEHSAWISIADFVFKGLTEGISQDTIAVPNNWMDSDLILDITEANGGSEFRLMYPDAEILIFLGDISFAFDKFEKVSTDVDSHLANRYLKNYGVTNNISYQNISLAEPNIESIEKMNSSNVLYGIQYYSSYSGEDLMFFIDPVTGEILNAPTTAAVAEQAAYPIAQGWSSDAKLWNIFNQFNPLDSLGTTDFWTCMYYSPFLDSIYAVIMWGQIPVNSGSPGFPPSDTLTIPSGWLDSDECLLVAEANGGNDYRISNPDAVVNASLTRWFQGYNPDLTVWTFTYSSSTAQDIQILVNAFTGTIVGVDPDEVTYLPENFNLYQNYPNPFNPITRIVYELAEKDFVTLTVYNLIGSEVAVLVKEEKEAGRYVSTFDASKLASGVYIYTLKSNKTSLSRKLVLLK